MAEHLAPERSESFVFDLVLPWLMQNVLPCVKEGVAISPLLAEHRIAPRAAPYVCDGHDTKRVKSFRRRLKPVRRLT